MSWIQRPCRRGALAQRHYRRISPVRSESWQLRWVPVCSSTERLLKQWLHQDPLLQRPRAVVARHQRRAVGQRGREWQAPTGGVWLSAALPVDSVRLDAPGAGLFGLAVALALAERLERAGVAVRIKWPNDLLVEGRKLAGILPALQHRGHELRLLRCGVGLNVCNAVPAGAVALRHVLPAATADVWTAEVLLALDASTHWLRNRDRLLVQVRNRLWADQIDDPDGGPPWTIQGLTSAGGLQLQRGGEFKEWIRWP